MRKNWNANALMKKIHMANYTSYPLCTTPAKPILDDNLLNSGGFCWQDLFQAVPTDVGICCAFNFNSTMKETVYARWGTRRRQYLAFKGWSRSWSRRRVRRKGWRCWRWRRARLALTWDSRSFFTFIFSILSKMFNFCMHERLSVENLALALSCLFIGATIDKNWKFEMPSFMMRKPYGTDS